MRGKNIYIAVIAVFALVIMGTIYMANPPFISMGKEINGEEVEHVAGFQIESEKEIVVKYDVRVKEGNLTIKLFNKGGIALKEFQTQENFTETIILEKGNYYLRIESDTFTGKYSLKLFD